MRGEHPSRGRRRVNPITQARKRLDLQQLESDYRGTRGQRCLSSDERPTLGPGTTLAEQLLPNSHHHDIGGEHGGTTRTASGTSHSVHYPLLHRGLYREDVDNLLDVDPLEPIRLELDEEEDSAVYTWPVAL
ncbi:hypothetical protein F2Q69_00035346 [Brassica cretica]|uniref:Uncharacterized protein n=1 Tax=Brassica cretica TaxID=69181 RepID=A0A8S9SKX5_BRACR|nr:hypothetical protein F2Q69_00035346 [Brassica cretica]